MVRMSDQEGADLLHDNAKAYGLRGASALAREVLEWWLTLTPEAVKAAEKAMGR